VPSDWRWLILWRHEDLHLEIGKKDMYGDPVQLIAEVPESS
jgi:hypothetical protein